MYSRGFIKDPRDDRDLKFKSLEDNLGLKFGSKGSIPKKVDLRRMMSPVRNQGELGSCTAQSVVGLMESVQLEILSELKFPLSPLFLYYNTRVRMCTVERDTGASLREAIKSAADSGVCAESEWPYEEEEFTVKPSEEAYDSTNRIKIRNYYRIEDFQDLKRSLASTNPVVLGLMLYDSFFDEKVKRTGIVSMPNLEVENFVGGHAITAVGYDDESRTVIIRNSWGGDWGDEGYAYIPYNYFNGALSVDMWTCTYTTED